MVFLPNLTLNSAEKQTRLTLIRMMDFVESKGEKIITLPCGIWI